jgi:hypothetical protein
MAGSLALWVFCELGLCLIYNRLMVHFSLLADDILGLLLHSLTFCELKDDPFIGDVTLYHRTIGVTPHVATAS